MVGANDDDFKLLIAKRFVLVFDSGVIVIKHWRIHNYIQNDRCKPTVFQDEKALLGVKKNGSYTEKNKLDTEWIQNGYILDTQVRLGKDSLGKDSKDIRRFVKPSLNEVSEYCISRKNNVDAQSFIDFYESKGWKIGNTPMKDWKAAVRTWERNNYGSTKKPIHSDVLPDFYSKPINSKPATDSDIHEVNEMLKSMGSDNDEHR